MTIKLFIKKNSVNAKGVATVFLRYSHQSKSCVFSTGVKVDPKDFNQSKGRIKKTAPLGQSKNLLLKRFVGQIESIVSDLWLEDKSGTVREVKDKYNQLNKNDEPEDQSFFGVFDRFILDITLKRAASTVLIYERLKSLLKSFELDTKMTLSFDGFDLGFFERFVSYQLSLGYLNGTVKRNCSFLKAFLNHCFKSGYINSTQFRDFKFKVYASPVLYLSKSELKKIKEVKLNRILSITRDEFLLSCYTGLRVSDIPKITRSNIKWYHKLPVLYFTPKKTKKEISIPLNDHAIEILERMDYRILSIAVQTYNERLKKIAKLAGIDTPITIVKFSGSKRIEETVPKWKLISSHTGRRTFINLCLHELNLPVTVVAQLTHGGNLQSLQRYIGIDKQQITKDVNDAWKNFD